MKGYNTRGAPARCAAVAVVLAVAGCGASETSGDRERSERATVFDPLVETIDRAEDVQQRVDERAAEQRRRIEEAQ